MAFIDLLNKQQAISNNLPNTTLGQINADIDANEASINTLEGQAYQGVITDPGDGGAIPITESGNMAVTSAGVETRTMAAPAAAGVIIDITTDVYVGDVTITVASAFNLTGNNTMILGEAGEHIRLVSAQVGSAFVWRVDANDGVALSTA